MALLDIRMNLVWYNFHLTKIVIYSHIPQL